MSYRENWRRRVVEAKNYPCKTGESLSDIIIIFLGGFIIGFSLGEIYFYNLHEYLFVPAFLTLLVIFYAYRTIWHQLKSYEKNYGSSKVGDEWLKRRMK